MTQPPASAPRFATTDSIWPIGVVSTPTPNASTSAPSTANGETKGKKRKPKAKKQQQQQASTSNTAATTATTATASKPPLKIALPAPATSKNRQTKAPPAAAPTPTARQQQPTGIASLPPKPVVKVNLPHLTTTATVSSSGGGQARAMSTSSTRPLVAATTAAAPTGNGNSRHLDKPKQPTKAQKRERRERQERAQRSWDRASSTGSIERSDRLISLMRNSGSTLSKQMIALVESEAPKPEIEAVRKEIIQMMERAINSASYWWGHPHSRKEMPLRIAPFGSNAFGLSNSSSDLDLCILDPYRPFGWIDKWDEDKLPTVYNVHKIAEVLREKLRCRKVLPIASAAVHIVKFEIEHKGHVVQGDLNINDRLGIMNSALINTYCELHPQLRPLASFVKFWATQRALKDSSGRKGPISFSSYTLILLVIAFMQSRSLLPNLQDKALIESEHVPPSAFFSTPRRILEKGQPVWRPPVGWDTTFLDRAPVGFAVKDDVELDELVKGFFDWLTDFPFESRVVSIEQGGSFARVRNYDEHVVLTLADQVQKARLERDKADAKRKAKQAREAALADDPDTSANGLAAMLALAGNESTDHSGILDGSRRSRRSQKRTTTTESDMSEDDDDSVMRQLFPSSSQESKPAPLLLDQLKLHDLGASADEESSLTDDSMASKRRAPSSSASSKSKAQAKARPASPRFDGSKFEEPPAWTQRIIVQDPFVRSRNTAKNVSSAVAAVFVDEVRRAAILLHAGEPIETICERVSVEQLQKRYDEARAVIGPEPGESGGEQRRRRARSRTASAREELAHVTITTTDDDVE